MRTAIRAVPRAANEYIRDYATAKREALDAFTVEYINEALRVSGGSIKKAARLARMDRSNFRRIVRAAQRLQRKPGR